jgi:hypothetical protein
VNAYSTAAWTDLFLAEAGASAALSGLLFVAISINIDRILAIRRLAGRAAQTIVLLVVVLLVSSLALVPGQSRQAIGGELLGVGVAAWAVLTTLELRTLRDRGQQPRSALILSVGSTQIAAILFVVAPVSLLARAGGGLYWLVPAVLLALVDAMLGAWVLLVEILR